MNIILGMEQIHKQGDFKSEIGMKLRGLTLQEDL